MKAHFWGPGGISAAPDGSVRVMDSGNVRVRKIYAGGVSIENFAGPGGPGEPVATRYPAPDWPTDDPPLPQPLPGSTR